MCIRDSWKYSIIGCLRRIEYPTGGFTEFEYEANRARYIVLKRNMHYDLNENMRSFERYDGDEILKYKYLLDGKQLVRVKRYPGTKDSEGKVAFGIEEADNPCLLYTSSGKQPHRFLRQYTPGTELAPQPTWKTPYENDV